MTGGERSELREMRDEMFAQFNVLDAKAPFDPNTYGGNNYNPAWSSAGVIGRAFRGGATFKF